MTARADVMGDAGKGRAVRRSPGAAATHCGPAWRPGPARYTACAPALAEDDQQALTHQIAAGLRPGGSWPVRRGCLAIRRSGPRWRLTPRITGLDPLPVLPVLGGLLLGADKRGLEQDHDRYWVGDQR